RENAGELLLGICMFRLPTAEDRMILSPVEIAAALADTETKPSTAISIETVGDRRFAVRAENTGNASSTIGDGAMTVDIDLPEQGLNSVSDLVGFTSYESLCWNHESLEPCSILRARVLRLSAASWRPGEYASAALKFESKPPPHFRTTFTMKIDDGRVDQSKPTLPLENRDDEN
ncbi:MAG: hypothetical protein ABJB34_03185, partial [Acidobacteriota bacterium]